MVRKYVWWLRVWWEVNCCWCRLGLFGLCCGLVKLSVLWLMLLVRNDVYDCYCFCCIVVYCVGWEF